MSGELRAFETLNSKLSAHRSLLVLQLLSKIFQRRPARVLQRLSAIALLLIQVPAAMRAQTFAVLTADRLQRKRQQNLLSQDIFQEQTLPLIIPDLRLGCRDRKLFFARIRALRTVEQLEAPADIAVNRLQASGTSQVDPGGEIAGDPDVIDQLVLAVVLLDQLRASGAAEVAFLPNIRAKINHAGCDVLVKIDGMGL